MILSYTFARGGGGGSVMVDVKIRNFCVKVLICGLIDSRYRKSGNI